MGNDVIALEEYFRKPHSLKQAAAAVDLLDRVNALCAEAIAAGAFEWQDDPDTNCEISGKAGGDGDGGFRTPGSRTGSARSSHREACGVDPYDPGDRLDAWLDRFEQADTGFNSKLAEHGLYREHPSATPGWCHLTTRAPDSGKRTFYP